MQIAVITVERDPMYLYDTLEQLIALTPIAQRIDVFVGTPTFDSIASRICTYTRPHRIPPDLWELIEPLPPKLRAIGNFVAALRSSDDDLMIFEDDIAIKPGWRDALVKAMMSSDLNTFVSLYSHIDRRRPKHTVYIESGSIQLEWPLKTFYGTLGLFVPSRHRHGLAGAATMQLAPAHHLLPEQRPAFDQIVTQYINDHCGCSMIVTIPSYVDHRGDVSTINPTHGPRRAPMF